MAIFRFDDESLSATLQVYWNPNEPGTLTLDEDEEVNIVSLLSAYGEYHTAHGAIELTSTNDADVRLGVAQEEMIGLMNTVVGEQKSRARLGTATQPEPKIDNSDGYTIAVHTRIPEPGLNQTGTEYTGPNLRYYGEATSGPYFATSTALEPYAIRIRPSRGGAGSEIDLPGSNESSTWFLTSSGNHNSQIYRDAVLVADNVQGEIRDGFGNVSIYGLASSGSTDATAEAHTAILAIYNGVLDETSRADVHELMLYWEEHGEAPGGETAPVVSNPQPSVRTVTAPEGTTYSATATGQPSPTVKWKASTDGAVWDDAENVLSDARNTTTSTLLVNSTTSSDNEVLLEMWASNTVQSDVRPSNSATLLVETITYPTTHLFGPITINDLNATVTWQCIRDDGTGGPDWVDAEETVANGGLSDISVTRNVVGNGLETSMNIETAQVADSGQIRCLATTLYHPDGEPSFTQTLRVLPAGE